MRPEVHGGVHVAGAKQVTARFTNVTVPTIAAPDPTARIASVSVVRANGFRVVRVALRVSRHTDALAKLTRRGRTVASARTHLTPGRRTLRLRVPRTARAGAYRLALTLAEGGTRIGLARFVRFGRP